jgi:hypothetical protein
VPHSFQRPLTDDERIAIVLAARSTFAALRSLYEEVEPVFERHRFSAPSTSALARDLAQQIETAIVQHCPSFSKDDRHRDLQRDGRNWHVQVSKDSELSINHSKVVAGENYIVVNYKAQSDVFRIWVLWDAQDHFFTPKRLHSNARALIAPLAKPRIDVLYEAAAMRPAKSVAMAKASLSARRRRRTVVTG